MFETISTNGSTTRNIWKALTIGLAVLIILSVIAYLVVAYLFPSIGVPSFINLRALGTGLVGLILGVLVMAAMILIPILLLIIFSMIVGYGFGLGFSLSDVGKAIIAHRSFPPR